MGYTNKGNSTGLIAVGILVFGIGLTVEGLKVASQPNSNRSLKLFGLSLEDESATLKSGLSRLFKRDSEAASRARLRLSGRSPLAANGSITASGASNLVPKEIAVDQSNRPDDMKAALTAMAAKKAKADKAAKEKKKKKQSGDNDPNKELAQDVRDKNPKSNSARSNADALQTSGFGGGGGASAFAQPQAAQLNTNPTTADEWTAFIAAEPVHERMVQLVEKFQIGEVQNDLFQTVMTQLLELPNNREAIQTLVIMALGSSPSTESFLKLTDINQRTASSQDIKVQTRNHLRAYSRIEYLGFLSPIITSSTNQEASIEAMRLVELSIQQLVRSLSNSPGTVTGSGAPPSQQPPVQPTLPSSISGQYTQMIQLLTQLAANSPDSTIRAQAAQTLESLKKFVS